MCILGENTNLAFHYPVAQSCCGASNMRNPHALFLAFLCACVWAGCEGAFLHTWHLLHSPVQHLRCIFFPTHLRVAPMITSRNCIRILNEHNAMQTHPVPDSLRVACSKCSACQRMVAHVMLVTLVGLAIRLPFLVSYVPQQTTCDTIFSPKSPQGGTS